MSTFSDFDNGEPVHRITRAQLIDDGRLVDVSRLYSDDVAARGIACHVAMTDTAFAAAVAPIDDEAAAAALEALGERHDARMRRVLAAYRRTIQAQAARLAGHPVASFAVPVAYGRDDVREIDLKAIVGRGDEGEIVLTILLPGED